MKKTIRILALMAVMATAFVAKGAAQTTPAPAIKGFLNVDFGSQPSDRAIAKTETRAVYGETATISSTQPIGGGAMFQISGGYRVWRSLAVGIGFSRFSDTSDGTVNATIPNPLFFGQLKSVSATATGLNHSENGIHLQATWFIPITTKFDVSVAVGPSFIHVSQDVPLVTIPAGTQTIAVSTASEEGTAAGANIGVALNYLVTKNFGGGFFMRYAGGKVSLPSAPDLSVGGFQIGIGARVRF